MPTLSSTETPDVPPNVPLISRTYRYQKDILNAGSRATGQITIKGPTMQTPNDVLTVRDLAGLLRIGRNAAYAAIHSNTIPGVVHLGRRTIRISRSAVEQWMLTSTTTGGMKI